MNDLPELKPYSQVGEYGTMTVNGVTRPLIPEPGYALLPEGEAIKRGDKPYDYYAGWIQSDGYHAKNKYLAHRGGRWLAWERRIKKSGKTIS